MGEGATAIDTRYLIAVALFIKLAGGGVYVATRVTGKVGAKRVAVGGGTGVGGWEYVALRRLDCGAHVSMFGPF